MRTLREFLELKNSDRIDLVERSISGLLIYWNKRISLLNLLSQYRKQLGFCLFLCSQYASVFLRSTHAGC